MYMGVTDEKLGPRGSLLKNKKRLGTPARLERQPSVKVSQNVKKT